MRFRQVTKWVLGLAQLVLIGWVVFITINRFVSEGWKAGLSHLALGLLAAAIWVGVAWWFDRLPEPEERDWSN